MNFKLGTELHGFTVESVDKIEKINQCVYQLKYKKNGASLVHLSNKDTNNAFGIGFLTCPQDSSGVAHILEHLVLCGSKKFPVKDPFFSMLRRSLANFMNAFTASDWTMYPFSSQNPKDFYNLMDVYTDAVFFPLLKEKSFQQEAHRLEQQGTETIAQGVVFNEMKGAMSSPMEIMYRRTLNSVFPSITYHHNSGGEPVDILDLDLAQLQEFHKIHYHPSNAKFFSYGSFPLEKTLSFLAEKVLSHFQTASAKKIKIGKEKRYSKPQSFQFSYPLNPEETEKESYQIALSWLVCAVSDSQEVLALSLMEQILLGSLAAPLRYKLIESNLGKDLGDTTGYHSDYSETFFSVGLKGVAKKNLQAVEDLILDGLKEIVAQKIEPSFIESAIHQTELDIREISEGRYPYSLNLFFRFVGSWMNSGDIIKALSFDEQVESIKQKSKKGGYFESLIQKYLIDNPHRVRVELHPSKDYMKQQEYQIQQKVAQKAKATIPQNSQIATDKTATEKTAKEKTAKEETATEKTAKLKSDPAEAENLDCLPRLELKEIVLKTPRVKSRQKNGMSLYKQPTNGLEYWSIYLDNPNINFENLGEFTLICGMLTKIGTQKNSYEEFSALLNQYTGGIAFAACCASRLGYQNYHQFICASAKSLNSNKEKMKQLLEEILLQYSFANTRRIQQWISEITLAKTNSIVAQGHQYAVSLASRHFSKILKMEEQQSGIHSIKKIKEFQNFKDKDWQELAKEYQKKWQQFLEQARISFFSVGDENQNTDALFSALAKNSQIAIQENWSLYPNLLENKQPLKEIWKTSVAVSYVVRSYPTSINAEHPDSAKLVILSKLLQAGYIHQEIREKGGAYGGIVSFQRGSGIFSFLSYRDPRLFQTWETYQKAIDWVLKGSFSATQVKEAILQTFGNLDKPLSPAALASSDFLKQKLGESPEVYEEYRKRLISIEKKDLVEVAQKWLTSENYNDVAISSEEILKNTPKLDSSFAVYNI